MKISFYNNLTQRPAAHKPAKEAPKRCKTEAYGHSYKCHMTYFWQASFGLEMANCGVGRFVALVALVALVAVVSFVSIVSIVKG